MSIFDDVASLARNADTFSVIVAKVEAALLSGVKGDTPEGRQIGAFIREAIPDIAGAPDMVDKIDALIPDSIQSQFGFTPQVMTFIKEALGSVEPETKTPAVSEKN